LTPRFARFAAVFYGALVLVAVAWNALRGREMQLLGQAPLLGLLYGLLAAALTVSLGLLVYRLVPVMRRIAEEIAPHVVDGARTRDLLMLSVLSGIGEEALFRGAVQPEFGLVAASVVFGLVHVGPDRRYLVWTFWAMLAGFLFGWLYLATGALLAPVVAHATHNAVTLLLWKRSRQDRGKPGEGPAT
jgi:uncharacterized protein